jgi:hypothetical protein
MRQLSLVVFALLVACRGDHAIHGGDPGVDASVPDAPDVPPDGVPESDGIAAARAAADGTGLALAIHGATVTYEKPPIGSATNDPAGFTIQAVRPGPGCSSRSTRRC